MRSALRAIAICVASSAAVLFVPWAYSHAEEAGAVGTLELPRAVAYALQHHPALRVQKAAVETRDAEVDVARASYLPGLDLSAEILGNTGNVLRGSVFPLPGVPVTSGPPTSRDIGNAALGSEIGVSLHWDCLGLVREMAEVDAALAAQSQARTRTDVTRLSVAYQAADQFIDVIVRSEVTRAARATVERAKVLTSVVKALVDQELRPGADYSRAAAEEALAATLLIRAEQAEAVSHTVLARALGAAGGQFSPVAGRLLEPHAPPAPTPQALNPELQEAEAALTTSAAQRRAIELQYLPRLDVVGALWARGSGLTSGPLAPSPGRGIVPDTPNWAVGLLLTWPAVELVAVRARTRAQSARVRGAAAWRDDIAQAIEAQIQGAHATLAGAQRIAQNTPIALVAARDAEAQASARYKAGLASIDLIAEAERVLAQAETDDAVARLNVRRAELLLARSLGDLTPFLNALRSDN